MLIAEMVSGNRVLAVDKSGRLSLLAGTGVKGFSGDGGAATAAQFNGIHNLAIAKTGDIYLADSWNYRVRKLSPDGKVTTFAGVGKKGFGGDGGAAKDAEFATLIQIALDPTEKHLFVADIENRRIRRIALDSGIVTTVAGNGKSGVPADGATAVDAPLSDPRAVVPAADGSFYVLERGGHALRFVDAAGKIRTVMGTGKAGLSTDGSRGPAAAMNGPKHACLDRDGTVIIADAENNVVVRYNPKTDVVSRIAGTGKKGNTLTNDAVTSELSRPHGVTIAPDGALIITDSYNDRVLKLVK
jgi:DNA-binding beta-propeller fold protein YncE